MGGKTSQGEGEKTVTQIGEEDKKFLRKNVHPRSLT